MIRSILVATDASPASNRAIDLAAEMAGQYDATLHLLYVVRDMQLAPELKKMAEVEKIAGARMDVLKFVGNKILTDAKARSERMGATMVETHMATGDPATAIVEQAERNGIDLVVLGTRGLSEVKGMLMGSVSRKVANMCEKNCLIVR